MASPDPHSILPPPRPDVFPMAFSVTQEDVDWLDLQAERLNTNRSLLLREILRNLRDQQDRKTS